MILTVASACKWGQPEPHPRHDRCVQCPGPTLWFYTSLITIDAHLLALRTTVSPEVDLAEANLTMSFATRESLIILGYFANGGTKLVSYYRLASSGSSNVFLPAASKGDSQVKFYSSKYDQIKVNRGFYHALPEPSRYPSKPSSSLIVLASDSLRPTLPAS